MFNADVSSISTISWQSAGRHVAPLGPIILILSQPVFDLTPHNNFVPTHDLPHSRQAYHYTIRMLTKNLVETELPGGSGGNSGSLISRDDIVNVLCYY